MVKACENLTLIVFLGVSFLVYQEQKKNRYVTIPIQKFGVYNIMIMIVFELIFLLINLIQTIYFALREKCKKKQIVKNKDHFGVEDFKYIVYLWEKRVPKYVSKREDNEDDQDGEEEKEPVRPQRGRQARRWGKERKIRALGRRKEEGEINLEILMILEMWRRGKELVIR